ncbi:Transcriptional regulator PHO23-like protein 2 [Elsinoe fawcettii]|nr:Transcriptional regulator PHO23-like protein 2 [Elsinoe fawcettii]
MASTRSQTREETAPTCHVLNYFYDKEDGFALTALVHTLRFHIMVDPEQLESEEIRAEYLQLLKTVQGDEDAAAHTSKKRKRDETDSGYGSSPIAGSPTKSSENSMTLAEDDREDNEAVRALQNWCLNPFGDIFAKDAPASEEKSAKTVHDWFHGRVFYYTLTCSADGTITPTPEDPTKPLEERITELIPTLRLPKYITSHSLSLISTSSLHILECADTPSPRHPSLVKDTTTNKTHFLKLVDPSQPGPVKRELKILLDIAAKDLSSHIRVPLIEGLVIDTPSPPSSSTSSASTPCSILGFLLTPIPSATPLTQYLDSDTAESHREKWAREVSRTVDVLHKAGIVWGDAKADNFMVDGENKLWIIDFGGSYTEGWVDEEKKETLEGDRQGTEKVVRAVSDPEEFTFDPDEEGEEQGEDEGGVKKRKTEEEVRRLQHDEEEEEEEETDREEGEGDEEEEADKENVEEENNQGEGQEKYCYCNGPDQGKMIACDGGCDKEWFHLECTGLKEVPAKNEKWYCDDCKS